MNRGIEKLRQYEKIIIYGAGKYGRDVLAVLEEYGLRNKVVGFAVSDANITAYMLEGAEVKPVYDYKECFGDSIFICAIAEENVHELISMCMELGIKHYIKSEELIIWKSLDKLEMKKISENHKRYIESESGNREADKSESFTHVTYCVAGNAGDTMLSQCVRKALGFGAWKIQPVNGEISEQLIHEINERKGLVIGGGGLFLPDTNENMVSGWQWAISEEQIERISVPIIVYAVGYNYFKGQDNSELFIRSVNQLVGKADFVGLRNHGSVRAIREIVGEDLKERITYQPCPTTVINRLYAVKKQLNTRVVGINIAFDREERRYGNQKVAILEQIADAIKQIEEMGYQIVYIAHSYWDLRFLRYLDELGVKFSVRHMYNALPDEIIKCYEDVELMFGMRGHAQMIPFGVGCRIISLGTHDKMRWFLEDIDALDWYIDITKEVNVLAEKIVAKFKNVNIENSVGTDMKIEREQEKLWDIFKKNKEMIERQIEQADVQRHSMIDRR